MTVVGIVAISATIAAPALSEAMAVRRAGEATHSLVRLGARGRAEAMAFGRAHLMVYSDTSSGSPGTLGSAALWRGLVDRCSANDWATIVTGACSGNVNCIDQVDMGRYAYPYHQVQMRLNGAGTAGTVCFQPDGEMLYAPPAGNFVAAPPVGADSIRFDFQRLSGGAATGVTRSVVFPFGAGPRLLR